MRKNRISDIVFLIALLLFTNLSIHSQVIVNNPDSTINSTADTNFFIHSSQNIDTTKVISDSTSIITKDTSLYINHFRNLTDTTLILGDSATSRKDSLNVVYFNGSIENLKLNNFTYIDTNTYGIQNYDPLTKNDRLFATLSNIGQASRNMVFSPTLAPGYYTGLKTFSNYMTHNSKIKYYRLFVPYTELNYVMGSKREQNFNVIFTRQIFTGFTFGINYALNFSPSDDSPYNRNGVNNQRVYATAQYYTPNKRYGLIANYVFNKLVVEENGGITYDSLFEDNIESDRSIIPVKLGDAENFMKKSGFYIEQYFNILSPRNKTGKKHKIDPGHVSYAFQYQRNQFIYTDGEEYSDFYFNNSIPLDSASTYDSLYQSKFENTIRWSNIGYQDDPASKIFYMFLGVSMSQTQQMLPYDSISTSINQTKSFGGVAFNFGKSFLLNADAYYITGNYNNGDYGVNGTLRQYLGNINRNIGYLKFDLKLISRTPDWYYNKYQSNYYRWDNNLDKENFLIIKGTYNYKHLSAGVEFTTVGNYTYMSDSIRPKQLSKGETVLKVFAEGRIPMNKFGVDTRLVYQKTSQPNVIRVPEFTGIVDMYFRSTIFKKAATLQTGFQVTYFTKYYADAYMPELRLFYIQNEKEIGNYPYADFYLTLMVKRAKLFFKVAHFNSYFGNYTYYLTPHYPARDASFYFGASWRFHD